MNDDQLDNHHGGCLCGKVRYSLNKEPFGVVVCMCHFCQKITGSDYIVLSVFKKTEFKLDQDMPGVYEHVSEGSGHKIFIHFCRDCGTTLFHYFERFKESVGVFSGTFDNPNWFERSPETVEYFFLESAPRGAMVPAGYKTYSGHCLNLDGELLDPTYFENHKTIGVDGH
jgi:hypothetical protein